MLAEKVNIIKQPANVSSKGKNMQINREKVISVALSFVEAGQDYDKEEVIAQTAVELADQLRAEFIKEMPVDDQLELRRIFKGVARNCIDWTRLNRKAHPDEYADSAWRMAEEIAQMEANI